MRIGEYKEEKSWRRECITPEKVDLVFSAIALGYLGWIIFAAIHDHGDFDSTVDLTTPRSILHTTLNRGERFLLQFAELLAALLITRGFFIAGRRTVARCCGPRREQSFFHKSSRYGGVDDNPDFGVLNQLAPIYQILHGLVNNFNEYITQHQNYLDELRLQVLSLQDIHNNKKIQEKIGGLTPQSDTNNEPYYSIRAQFEQCKYLLHQLYNDKDAKVMFVFKDDTAKNDLTDEVKRLMVNFPSLARQEFGQLLRKSEPRDWTAVHFKGKKRSKTANSSSAADFMVSTGEGGNPANSATPLLGKEESESGRCTLL